MLTTLVITISCVTILASLLILAMTDPNTEAFWDPRARLETVRQLVRSCATRSRLWVSGHWSTLSGRPPREPALRTGTGSGQPTGR